MLLYNCAYNHGHYLGAFPSALQRGIYTPESQWIDFCESPPPTQNI